MTTSVKMPQLGESVTKGTVTRWLKSEGEHVDADEPLLEVSTDKVDTEVPSPAAGTLLSIKVVEDETVEIGVELALIGDPGEGGSDSGGMSTAAEPEPEPAPAPEAKSEPVAESSRPSPSKPAAATAAPPVAATPAAATAAAEPSSTSSSSSSEDEASGPYVTPLVRKLASEHGVDLTDVDGTGVGGRIRKSDVLAAAKRSSGPASAAPAASAPAASAAAAPRRGTIEPMSRMRQAIATRMVESLQTSAQLTTVVEVDVTKVARLRDLAKADFHAREGVKLSFPAVLRPRYDGGAQSTPDLERIGRHDNEDDHLSRERTPGHRGGHRTRPAGPGHP